MAQSRLDLRVAKTALGARVHRSEALLWRLAVPGGILCRDGVSHYFSLGASEEGEVDFAEVDFDEEVVELVDS